MSFKRLLTVMTRPSIIILVFLLITCSFFYIDRPVATYFYELDLLHRMPFLSVFTSLGTVFAYVMIFFVGALYFRFRQINLWEARMWFLWFCVCITWLLCFIIKILLGRARPSLWFENQLYGFYGLQKQSAFWSFPSGHTTCIMAVMFGFSIIFPRYFYSFISLGLLVALSRIVLIQHYLSDILIAAYLSLIEIGILLWYLQSARFKNCSWNLFSIKYR